MDAAEERRLHPRAEIEATVVCKGVRGFALLALDGANVGVGGILLRSAVDVSEGQEVDLELTLPVGFVPIGPSTLSVRGLVVRHERRAESERPFEIAVQFSDLSAEQEEMLDKYVRRKLLLGRR